MKKLLYTLIVLVAGVGFFWAGVLWNPAPPLGSVSFSSEYYATNTPVRAAGGSWADRVIKVGQGSLGSVIITTAGTVKYDLFDATSVGSLSTGNFNRETRRLASIDASQAAGTYVFDSIFTRGLVIDVQVTGTGTSTITYR